MRSHLGRKFPQTIALALSFISFLAVVLTGTLIARSMHRNEITELEKSLGTQANLIGQQTGKEIFRKRDAKALHALAHDLANTAQCRVTFIAPDGQVLGDSSLTFDKLATVENHRSRPEVQAALAAGEGSATRLSATVHEDFLYVAAVVQDRGAIVGVTRLAFPLTELKNRQWTIRLHIILLSLAALVVVVLTSFALVRPLSRPVSDISEQARELADRMQVTGEKWSHDRAHLAAILSNMEEGVIAVGINGRVIAMNAASCEMFEIKESDAIGKLFLEAVRQSLLNNLIQNVLREVRPYSDEVRVVAHEECIFEARAVPLMAQGRCEGALLVLHDITRLRRLEQVRRDFVANVSHELRTPLASIKGFAETLRTGALEDPSVAKGFVGSIEKHADNMTALVQDLLDLTAIESGQRQPNKEAVSLTDVIFDVTKGLNPIANKRKISIQNEIPEDFPTVHVDRGHLKQILVNLVENAIKFNHEGGWVKLSASADNGEVRLMVADSGSGIPSQDLPRIFERFYRVDKARSREISGTGLGLSIVKHLAEANGGSVTVESSARGSTFTVSLPRSA